MTEPAVQKFLDNLVGLPALWSAITNKFVAQESGKGLSTNDFTDALETKLNGIATGAEVNQNAFSTITVGEGASAVDIAADSKTDTLTIVAGSNVTITPDDTNDKITIAATDTTYSDVVADSTGAAASGLMTSADKYTLDSLVAGGGEPNQNAFSYVQVGEGATKVDIAADSKTDTITIVAGSNVTLTGDATNDKLTIAATDTTYSAVTADSTGAAAAGLMSSADKYKLDNVAAGAEVNQNAFSSITVGASSVAADAKTDSFELVEGSNVSLSVSGDAITIAATDTTYSAVSADSTGVAAAGLMSSADKYKLDHILSSSVTAGVTTSAPTCDAVHDAINAAISSVYRLKGSVADEASLPDGTTSGQEREVGDVYNIIAASTYGPAGMNVVWTGTAWDALGASITIEAMTAEEVAAICV